MIILDSIGKNYITDAGKTVEVLRDINLNIPEEQILVILGPSGCGKSTLLQLIAGFLPVSCGTLYSTDKTDTRQKISAPNKERGVVFQKPTLYPWLTVRQNVGIGAKLQGRQPSDSAMNELIELVGLSDFAEAYPYELSGGMQQRAQIARVLSTSPNTILMDEPFVALDPFTREKLQAELLAIWKKTKPTIVFVTHSVEEALLVGHRVIVLSTKPGEIIYDKKIPRRLQIGHGVTTPEECLTHVREIIADPEFISLRTELAAVIHESCSISM